MAAKERKERRELFFKKTFVLFVPLRLCVNEAG
jgi:hypothetical protein